MAKLEALILHFFLFLTTLVMQHVEALGWLGVFICPDHHNEPIFNLQLFPVRLFEGSSSRKIEKLKTLMCYFKSLTEQSRCSDLYFTLNNRETLCDIYHWLAS